MTDAVTLRSARGHGIRLRRERGVSRRRGSTPRRDGGRAGRSRGLQLLGRRADVAALAAGHDGDGGEVRAW